jgi:membrane-bound lytic murein transglycosylase D
MAAAACVVGLSTSAYAGTAPGVRPSSRETAGFERASTPSADGLAARAVAQDTAGQAVADAPVTPAQDSAPGSALPDPSAEPLAVPPSEAALPGLASPAAAIETPPAPPALEIPANARVKSFVDLFSGRLKNYLEDGLNRGARYLPMIEEVFRSEGVPLDLAYVPLVESAFKPNAVSRAKARGMWQFMHGTALENGLTHDWYIDERADPEKATRAAARYLKTLYGMFGDWNLALASYNGGPGRVQRAIKRSGRKDFWVISRTKKYLPRETRDYVPLILAAVTIARDPARYGMTILTPEDEPGVELVTLPGAVDLRRIAEWIDVPVQTIQDLNPELRRWTTPIKSGEYQLKVPAGQGDVVRAHLENGVDGVPLTHYIVKKSDTLASVARKLGVTRSDLAEANYLKVSTKVHPGQTLIVPRAPVYARASATSDDEHEGADAVNAVLTDADASSDRGTTKLVSRASATTGSRTSAASVQIVHRVKSGETLGSIADTYDTTVSSIRQQNHLKSTTIKRGQTLKIVVKRSVATD